MDGLKTYIFLVLFSSVSLLMVGQLQSEAQLTSHFGKNKVHYKDFHWATLKTSHFTIYFYQGEEQLARHTEKMAKRAYQYLSEILQHQVAEKIPLIIYASSDDFQQTEVIEGFLGEGIGGVTESLKGRIVIPFLGSYREFNHVLIHELVHAFQFDILSEAGSPISFFSNLYIPLWFIEGMAEYLSEHANPLTEMWLYDAVYHETLPQSKKIEALDDIRAYRFGEALVAYLAEQYGQQSLETILRHIGKTEDWEGALQEVADTSWKDFYDAWLNQLKEHYSQEISSRLPPDHQASLLISHKPDDFSLNILPAVSPDGKYVAFISDRDFYRTIYLASAETGDLMTPLVEGERRGTYETLRFLNTSIAWAPDSQHIAFNAKAGGENAIYIQNIHSKNVISKFSPDVTSLSFLAWSPDGKRIAFTGTKNGQEDLFLITLETQEVVQVTNDLYSNRHPAWSPDGVMLAFTTDAGDFSHPEELQFGPSNLALYDLHSQTTTLLTNTTTNDLTPVWSPDGTWLAFISDRNGLYNLYLMDLHGSVSHKPSPDRLHIIRVTNVNTGIVGLTQDTPALTWSRETGRLLFSSFSNKGWDIFTLDDPVKSYQEYRAEVGFDEELLPAKPDDTLEHTVGKKDWIQSLPEDEGVESEKYKARLHPDYIFGGGGGNEKNFIILARIGFSDMLSNHQLRIGCNVTSVFDESDFLIDYTNRAHRLSYQLAAFQYDDNLGSYTMEDGELQLDVERGIGITVAWPFDKFRRLELGVEGRMISGDLSQEGLETTMKLEDQKFAAPFLAYVHDTTLYTAIGPLDGKRSRIGLHPAFGEMTYLTLLADHRWYWHLTKRSTLAYRIMTIGSFGENARIFNIGGPGIFRGRESDDALQGTRVTLGNIAYRFPLLPQINILRGTIFLDTALVWTDTVQPFTTTKTDWVRLQDLHAAYGIGFRIPIQGPFGLLNVRLDIAQETDLSKNLGKRKVLFSIGNDF